MQLLQEIKVPQESVNDLTVNVMEILIQQGSFVEAEMDLFEIESSKTTFTIKADSAGYIDLLTYQGEEVTVGKTIAKIYDSPISKLKAAANPIQEVEMRNNILVSPIFSSEAQLLNEGETKLVKMSLKILIL